MSADFILFNARIRTMDAACPHAAALAVKDGQILAIGADADMRALAGRGTQVVDAGGRLVLPGFQDAHVHLHSGGLDLATAAQLYDCKTLGDLQSVLAAHAAVVPDLPVVFGAGWQPGLFGDHNLRAGIIDAVVTDRPAVLYDSSSHNACLNSAALKLAGIGPGTVDPPNGHIVRGPDGAPTGMLHEEAIPWAVNRLPALTEAHDLVGIRHGQAHANRHGITGIIDPRVTEREARAYGALAAAGELTLRVAGAALMTAGDRPRDTVDRLTEMRGRYRLPDFRVQSAKFFLDGVFENRTAALLGSYADPPGGNADLMFAPDHLTHLCTALDAARFQLHFHLIGDRAARVALDAIAAAQTTNGAWPALHQLAHLQLVDPADLPRIANLGAMANIQPLWARYDPVVPDIALDMIGSARLSQVYAFRRMLAAGAAFCLSSDWPVTTLNPFEIIETAVTRQARLADGAKEPFLPAEALTVEEAVLGYTAHAAAACWRGTDTGRLVPGHSADLILLDRDIFACPAHEIGGTQVLLTLFRGRVVHRQDGFGG